MTVRQRVAWTILVLFVWGIYCTEFLRAEEISGLQAATAIERALVDAIAKAERSVVAIARVRRSDRGMDTLLLQRGNPFNLNGIPPKPSPDSPDFVPNDYGTGVVVDRHGLILTNYHVLGAPTEYEYFITTADRKTYRARVHATDSRSDLAILAIEARDLQPIALGDGAAVKKGQIVIALGNPYAIARDGQASASWGIVSNISRKLGPEGPDQADAPKPTLHHFGTLIQTDAKLNFGTSGGALINLKGEMVGLTTSLAAASGYEQAAGFAVPVDDTFRRAIETLKQGREVEYGFLGILPTNLTSRDVLAGRQGVVVTMVVPGTAAQRAGLQTGDTITHVDDHAVHDADELVLRIGRLPADSRVRLTVDRDGRIDTLPVDLTKGYVHGDNVISRSSPAWRGIRVDYWTAMKDFQSRVFRGIDDLEGCVAIRDVEKDSPAWKEGLRPNMLITHVGDKPVSSPKEFGAATAEATGPVQLRLYLDSSERAVRTIPPDSG